MSDVRVWVIVVALVLIVLIVLIGRRLRRLQGGPSYNGFSVDHYDDDDDYEVIRRKRLSTPDPFDPQAPQPNGQSEASED